VATILPLRSCSCSTGVPALVCMAAISPPSSARQHAQALCCPTPHRRSEALGSPAGPARAPERQDPQNGPPQPSRAAHCSQPSRLLIAAAIPKPRRDTSRSREQVRRESIDHRPHRDSRGISSDPYSSDHFPRAVTDGSGYRAASLHKLLVVDRQLLLPYTLELYPQTILADNRIRSSLFALHPAEHLGRLVKASQQHLPQRRAIRRQPRPRMQVPAKPIPSAALTAQPVDSTTNRKPQSSDDPAVTIHAS
jgi:hypothetical protein